jgi:Zn-dependent protease with chaperone function
LIRPAALGAALIALAPGAAAVAQTTNVLHLDRHIEAQLRQRDPDIADLWRRAAEAGYRNQPREAAALYDEILARDPACAPALWAKGGAEAEDGNRARGIQLARQALTVESSPLGMAALAMILARGTRRQPATAEEKAEALEIARQASDQVGRSGSAEALWTKLALCEAAVEAGDGRTANDVSGQLYGHFNGPEVHACIGRMFLARGEVAAGRDSLALAKRMADEEIAANRRWLAQSSPAAPAAPAGRAREVRPRKPWTVLDVLKWTVLLWIGALLLLLVSGMVLGGAVLRTADDLARQRTAPEGGSALKRAYAAVLWASCAYYYASIPMLAVMTVALGGGILWAFIAAGRVPVKLALLVALMTLATLWAILRSLFVRVADDDPGMRLVLRAHPRLRALLHDVAAHIGTRPVDNVYLTPGTDLAVLERGGLGRQLRGSTERCLVLGVGVLDGFLVGPFKAVLGHEYGHFTNRDTAGGGFALAVRRSLLTMAHGLASSGAAAWYNPVWLFLNGFHRVFLRISQGASRLQEILADRWAVLSFGSKRFEEGLRHVIERSVRFDAGASRALVHLFAQAGPTANLYAVPDEPATADPEIERAVKAALMARPSPYDSHPAPMDRSRWARALNAPGTPRPEDDEPVWNLFSDPVAIQLQMTSAVRQMVMAAAAAGASG